MKIYKNEDCRKVRKSHLLKIDCAYCKYYIALYQKVGNSNLVKMYHDRIVETTMDISNCGAIFCPNCNERIATKYTTKKGGQKAYRLVPSAFNKSKI